MYRTSSPSPSYANVSPDGVDVGAAAADDAADGVAGHADLLALPHHLLPTRRGGDIVRRGCRCCRLCRGSQLLFPAATALAGRLVLSPRFVLATKETLC